MDLPILRSRRQCREQICVGMFGCVECEVYIENQTPVLNRQLDT